MSLHLCQSMGLKISLSQYEIKVRDVSYVSFDVTVKNSVLSGCLSLHALVFFMPVYQQHWLQVFPVDPKLSPCQTVLFLRFIRKEIKCI